LRRATLHRRAKRDKSERKGRKGAIWQAFFAKRLYDHKFHLFHAKDAHKHRIFGDPDRFGKRVWL